MTGGDLDAGAEREAKASPEWQAANHDSRGEEEFCFSRIVPVRPGREIDLELWPDAFRRKVLEGGVGDERRAEPANVAVGNPCRQRALDVKRVPTLLERYCGREDGLPRAVVAVACRRTRPQRTR